MQSTPSKLTEALSALRGEATTIFQTRRDIFCRNHDCSDATVPHETREVRSLNRLLVMTGTVVIGGHKGDNQDVGKKVHLCAAGLKIVETRE